MDRCLQLVVWLALCDLHLLAVYHYLWPDRPRIRLFYPGIDPRPCPVCLGIGTFTNGSRTCQRVLWPPTGVYWGLCLFQHLAGSMCRCQEYRDHARRQILGRTCRQCIPVSGWWHCRRHVPSQRAAGPNDDLHCQSLHWAWSRTHPGRLHKLSRLMAVVILGADRMVRLDASDHSVSGT